MTSPAAPLRTSSHRPCERGGHGPAGCPAAHHIHTVFGDCNRGERTDPPPIASAKAPVFIFVPLCPVVSCCLGNRWNSDRWNNVNISSGRGFFSAFTQKALSGARRGEMSPLHPAGRLQPRVSSITSLPSSLSSSSLSSSHYSAQLAFRPQLHTLKAPTVVALVVPLTQTFLARRDRRTAAAHAYALGNSTTDNAVKGLGWVSPPLPTIFILLARAVPHTSDLGYLCRSGSKPPRPQGQRRRGVSNLLADPSASILRRRRPLTVAAPGSPRRAAAAQRNTSPTPFKLPAA